MNMTPGSFDQRRELGIELSDETILSRLRITFERDWQHSHQLDLSDEGIMREMGKHGHADLKSLALAYDDPS